MAPLARVLRTDVNTLVAFREEMTPMEINRIMEEIVKEMAETGYEAVFDRARRLIREYPNCNQLICSLAQMMNFYLQIGEVEDKEKYEQQIDAWFETIALCEEKDLANMATVMLCQKAIAQKDYEKAQALLEKIPSPGIDKRLMQANIYIAQEDNEKAYGIYEKMVFEKANLLISSLTQLCELKCREKLYADACDLAALSRTVAEKFDLGSYIAGNAEFMVAVEMQDKEKTISALKGMLENMDDFPMQASKLYQHVNFKDNSSFESLRTMMKPVFDKDDSLDFIRNDPEFAKIIELLA